MKYKNVSVKTNKIFRIFKNCIFDFKYGGFLGGVVKSRFKEQGAFDTANSDYAAMPLLFKNRVEPGDVLVDVGCGKGRVLNWWLEQYTRHSIYGIEIDELVASNTAVRLSKYKQVKILSGSAVNNLPSGKIVVYMFNPFNGSVMDCFIDSFLVGVKIGRIDKRSKIIYYNPIHIDSFYKKGFEVSEIELDSGFHRASVISLINI